MNSSKIISQLVWGVRSLQTPTSWIYSTLKLWPEKGRSIEKVDFGVKAAISLKRSKTVPRLLSRTNTKLPTRFRLVPKSTTVD